MASSISSADAISKYPISIAATGADTTLFQIPDDAWLKDAGMNRERYIKDMEFVYDSFDGYIRPLFEKLNAFPEDPELKLLKAELNDIMMSPNRRARDPITIMRSLIEKLNDVIELYHDSRVKPKKFQKPEGPVEALEEITPEGVNQERAMVLLRVLKARPKEALSSEKCRDILEGSEGTKLQWAVVRRAMKALAEIYAPAIVYEQNGTMYRVRTNF